MEKALVVQDTRVVAVMSDQVYKSLHARRDSTSHYHEKYHSLARDIHQSIFP